MKKLLALFMLSILTGYTGTVRGETILDNRVVETIVTYQTFNELMPWQGNTPKTRYGYAVFIDDSRLLTTENLIRGHHLVELRRAREGKKIQAKVIMSDEQVNLAILEITEKLTDPAMPSLRIASTLPLDSSVDIVQLDEMQQIQRSRAKVLKAGMFMIPNAPFNSLAFKLLVDVDVNGDGVGVIQDNRLAGIIMSYNRATRTATMIPYSTINIFLDRYKQKPYMGFAQAGFKWKPLVDPAKRAYYNVKAQETGFLILSCLPGTGAYEVLEPHDVITEWDGHTIDNLGYYNDTEFGRINISHLIKDKRKPGDVVPLKIVRDRKEVSLNLKLAQRKESDSLVPENTARRKAEYLIEGGLVIREMTGTYLRAFGNSWQTALNASLVNRYYNQKPDPDKHNERIVILSHILPDPINIGYQNFNNLMITKINNKPVLNLDDVFSIASTDGHITRITTDLLGVDIVLDESSLDDANKRIAENYRIPDLLYRNPAK